MTKFIGLDIKKNSIRIASVTQSEDSIVVNEAKEVIVEGNLYKPSITNSNQLSKELSQLFTEKKLKQTNIIFSDFGFNLLIKTTKIFESLEKQKVKEAIFMELGTTIQIPFAEATFDILSVKPTERNEKIQEPDDKMKKRAAKETDKRELEVNFVVANEQDLIRVGDAILETKNIPYSVDMSALAYHRLFSHFSMQKMKRNMYLLFELNCGEAVVTVMHKGIPIYTQYAEYNPDHWKVKLASEEKRNWQDEWVFDEVYEKNKLLSSIDSINRMINTFSQMSTNSGIKYMLLVGENPLIEAGIADFLSEHIEVPVVTPNLNVLDSKGRKLSQRFYKSVGLAMKSEELK